MAVEHTGIGGLLVVRWPTHEDARGFFEQFESNIMIDPLEIEVIGDWAFVRTAVTGTLRARAGGEEIAVDGRELAIFRRQEDGEWKLWRLVQNGT
jgi:ketosteroid isomerase-like protein